METIKPSYPLFFTFRDVVSGNGFLAGVTMKGRVLMVQEEEDAWWLYGVQPGGMAASGATPQEAHPQFSAAFKSILFDIAASSDGYDAFREGVEQFFSEISEIDALAWEQARKAFRSGAAIKDPFVSGLPKDPAEEHLLEIERLDQGAVFVPGDNRLDLYATAA